MPMSVAGPSRVLDIRDGELRGETSAPPYVVKDGVIRGATRSGREWGVSEALLPLLDACDGTKPIGELCESPELEEAAHTLSPADAGLLAPLW